MPTPTTLSLYNGALAILKHRPLATAADDTEARYLLDNEFAKVKSWLLEQGLWNFALRTTMLEPDTGNTPSFGHSYAFEQPEDYVRLNAISADAYFYQTLENYIDEAGYWIASINPLYVSYVSDNTSYGGDLSKWTSLYERAFEYELAHRVAPHLTSMGADAMQEMERKRDKSLRDARSKDALNQPAKRPPSGRLVQSRGGTRGSSGTPPWR